VTQEIEVTARPLAECEAVIERGLATFVEVGAALLEIRGHRLYRETHATFEDYCRERWSFTDRRARYLMEAAEIGTMVPNVGNERQARALVAGEIRLLCLSREITRHLTDDGCPVCADGGELYCLDLERMDRIEAGIAARVAQTGGGI